MYTGELPEESLGGEGPNFMVGGDGCFGLRDRTTVGSIVTRIGPEA